MSEVYSVPEALEYGFFILSGGRSATANFIVSLPTDRLEDLPTCSLDKLTSVFVHLTRVSRYFTTPGDGSVAAVQALSVVCVADLRQASAQSMKQLTECLEAVEHHQRGTISAVYFLKPRNKTRSRVLKKLLGIKPSKKRPRIPLFKIALLKTVAELHSYVDVSQLTADFAGVLQYSQTSWLHMHNVVITCIEGCKNLLARLPSVQDRVELLREYETEGLTSAQVQQLLADLTEKFHVIISESSLPLYVTLSKQTLFLLDRSSSDTHLSLLRPELIAGLKFHLQGIYSELSRWNSLLEDSWRVSESQLTLRIQICRHKERAKEIERKICEYYQPLLREHPIVGKTLSQAELYRTHFTTTLYDPAKELLSQATDILEAVQKVKREIVATGLSKINSSSSASFHHATAVTSQEISDINTCLTTSIQPFTSQLQHLQQIYVGVHVFHLLFEKALMWYKKVLKFIPETLPQQCSTKSLISAPSMPTYKTSSLSKEYVVYLPAEWQGAVRVFLSRHPPPRQEHIDRLDVGVPQLVDRKMKVQARSLALRLQLLHSVLTSSQLPLKILRAVLSWKADLFGSAQTEKASGFHPEITLSKSHEEDSKLTKVQETRVTPGPEQQKSHGRKPPEKPPRTKKPPSQTKQLSRSQCNLASTAPGTGDDKKRKTETPSVRKNSSKSTPRPKSVDFNFNSSSTDGSVFDYERALSQMAAGTEGQRMKPGPRRSRDFKLVSSEPVENRHLYFGNKAIADHSGFPYCEESSQTHSRKSTQVSPPLTVVTTELENSKMSAIGHTQWQQGQKTKPAPLNISPAERSVDERFVRVTFTPQQLNSNHPQMFTFSSNDLLNKPELVAECPVAGLVQQSSHYDSVIGRIKEISTSDLDSFEKLQQMSKLLSLNTLQQDSSQKSVWATESDTSEPLVDFNGRSPPVSSSNSAMPHKFKNNDSKLSSSLVDSLSWNQSSEKNERPVEALKRMKKKLAKSLEEINTIPATYTLYRDQPFSSFGDFTGPYTPFDQRLFHSRNFISPSFLRPAASMIDINSKVNSDMTFKAEADLEKDYRNLEDLESLRDLQNEHMFSEELANQTKQKSAPVFSHVENNGKKALVRTPETFLQKSEGHNIKSASAGRELFPHECWSSGSSEKSDIISCRSGTDIDRLTIEAVREYKNQEAVTKSLRTTLRILEEEERRRLPHLDKDVHRFQRLDSQSDPSLEGEDEDHLLGVSGGHSQATSFDHGYGSWASKLLHSSSSDYGGTYKNWRRASTSSSESSAVTPNTAQASQEKIIQQSLAESNTVLDSH